MMSARIVIVEDERIVALNLKQRLTKLGYEIVAMATSGMQTLDEIERHRPDVVLMDINIEGEIDGIETASRIPEHHHVATIYLSAYAEDATLRRARGTKPYGFLLKPFSERELHGTIQMVLERRRLDMLLQANEARLNLLVEELREQITRRLNAEDALRQAQKMEAIGQLTGGIAHDFNNLVQGIEGAAFLLRRSLKQGDAVKIDRHLSTLEASAKSAAGLTHSLLAFARRQPLDPRPVDANDLAQEMAGIISRTVGEAIEVRLRLADDLWCTRCDVNQLESAILNLAINSRDAMPDGGTLIIETFNETVDVSGQSDIGVAAGQYVCVAVSDTGAGMSPETAERAFEPFFTTKEIGRGTGLGLSMIYGFARQSDGHAKILSELGRGTTVKLYLPASFEAVATPVLEIANEIRPAISGEVVLVVEDDPFVRSQVVEVLRDLGCTALEASDGPSGLQMLQWEPRIDLLITDMGLPGLNGRQVADGGRFSRPDLKVLFMTGYAENATAAEGFLLPGMQLLTKPFSLDAMATRINGMLHGAIS